MPAQNSPMLIGARYPNAGALPASLGLAKAARRLEEAGFDSLWTSDHLAMPEQLPSNYPFSEDGRVPWKPDLGWSDALVSLGIAAAVTSRIRLGTAVLVALLRSPLVVARQAASIALEAGGRFTLGVGVGWLSEEFAAVGVPFSDRGARLDAWIAVVQEVWSGSMSPRSGEHPYPNPHRMICRPAPPEPIPVLIGGLSPAALRRAGSSTDGWLGLQAADELDPQALAAAVKTVHAHARESGREPSGLHLMIQITGSVGKANDIAARVEELSAVGLNEIIVDVDWSDAADAKRTYETLASAAAA